MSTPSIAHRPIKPTCRKVLGRRVYSCQRARREHIRSRPSSHHKRPSSTPIFRSTKEDRLTVTVRRRELIPRCTGTCYRHVDFSSTGEGWILHWQTAKDLGSYHRLHLKYLVDCSTGSAVYTRIETLSLSTLHPLSRTPL